MDSSKYTYRKYTLRVPYQVEAFESIGDSIRKLSALREGNKKDLIGAFIDASVGAGKTPIMGAVCHRFEQMGWPVLCLARDLKLVEQNNETFWDMGVHASIYSAAYGKSMHYAENGVIVSNEATAFRAIDSGAWEEYYPRVIIVDECHQVPVDTPESQYMEILKQLNDKCIQKHGHPIILLGFTGSPYRHTTSIIGDVWKKCLYKIETSTLVDMGFLVPTIFGAEVGHDKSLDYDLSAYGIKSEHGTSDFSKDELAKMEKELIKDQTKLQKICEEVVKLTLDRNAVMITCCGVKHCKEVQKHLPENSAVIVHSGQSKAVNDEALRKIADGEAKFLLQVGCLTVGYDEPCIDTSVMLRRIGSLTLLVQLLGRGMRLLKDYHLERGLVKNDHLVLDYSGTLDEMMDLYENPILDECLAREGKAMRMETIDCPDCGTENNIKARRCIGKKNGQRCEYFFQFVTCEDRKAPSGQVLSRGCGTKNDPRSKVCRHCNNWLDDPSEGLNGKHYHDNDLIPVTRFTFGLTKSADKLIAQYWLANDKKAKQVFDISSKEKWRRAEWYKFLKEHVVSKVTVNKLSRCYNATDVVEHINEFRAPLRVTHRVNGKGFDLLARKIFDE